MINYGHVLVPKLLHYWFNFFLSADLDFVLFIKLVHSLCENLEHWLVSFAFRVYKLNIKDWRLLKPFYNLSTILIDFFVWIVDINSSLDISLLHRDFDPKKQSLLARNASGRPWRPHGVRHWWGTDLSLSLLRMERLCSANLFAHWGKCLIFKAIGVSIGVSLILNCDWVSDSWTFWSCRGVDCARPVRAWTWQWLFEFWDLATWVDTLLLLTESVRVLPRGIYSLVKELPCLPTSIIRIYGGSSPKTIIKALSSSEKSILHLHLLLPNILLPIGLDIEQ